MGKWTKGYLTQNFKISLDLDKLHEFIADKIVEAIQSEKTQGKQTFTDIEISDIDVDGNALFIAGNYDTAFEHWCCSATLESPAEDDLEYEGIEGWGDSLLCMLPDNLKELVVLCDVEANEDMIDFPESDYGADYYDDI